MYKSKIDKNKYNKLWMRNKRAEQKENARLKAIGQFQERACQEHGHIKCRCVV